MTSINRTTRRKAPFVTAAMAKSLTEKAAGQARKPASGQPGASAGAQASAFTDVSTSIFDPVGPGASKVGDPSAPLDAAQSNAPKATTAQSTQSTVLGGALGTGKTALDKGQTGMGKVHDAFAKGRALESLADKAEEKAALKKEGKTGGSGTLDGGHDAIRTAVLDP